MTTPIDSYNIPWTLLPYVFDPARLRAAIMSLPQESWVPHFNQRDYEGEWSSLSLRSASGRVDDIVPFRQSGGYQDTEIMAACPYLREAVETFAFPKKAVRLLRLHAGSRVREHVDRDLGLKDGEVRIHVPVITNDHVEFVVSNRRLMLREGESWYVDFSQPHRIFNGGSEDRIHLIIDGTLNPWTEELLIRSHREIVTETYEPEGIASLRRFQRQVFEDPSLQTELLAAPAHEFQDAVVAAGERSGFSFGLDEVDSLCRQGQREWTERTFAQ